MSSTIMMMKVIIITIIIINDTDYVASFPFSNSHFTLSWWVCQYHGPSTQLQKWYMDKAKAHSLRYRDCSRNGPKTKAESINVM